MNSRERIAAPHFWLALAELVAAWMQRARERHALAQLTARERRDMGLSRAAVEEEIRKPFWRA
jgi:uncharacterized protein YjiS (DUF1127 family)